MCSDENMAQVSFTCKHGKFPTDPACQMVTIISVKRRTQHDASFTTVN